MKILFVLLMLLVSSVANAEVPCDADPQALDPSSCGTARYMVAFRQLEEALQSAVDALSALMVAAGTGGTRNLNTTAAMTTADAKKAETKARKIASGFKPAGD